MPLRLVEVTIPEDGMSELAGRLEDLEIHDMWTAAAQNGRGTARILVDAEHSEALSDRLAEGWGSRDEFRIVLLPVEATLPALEEAPEEGDGEAASESDEPRRISREELYEDVAQASRLTRVYVVMVLLSTVVAAVGLLRGDVAIVIGAMVIAPLLGPNVALSLACTLGDLELAKRSLRAIGAGVGTAAAASVILGLLFSVDPTLPELAARTQAGPGDIALALAAGAAGTLAFTGGVPAVVVGVMVAVALLPPLVVAGLLAGAGHGTLALGATTLVLTNVVCINLAAVGTFLVQKVRPRTWWEADRAKRATRIAVATWVLMLAGLIAIILLGGLESV